MRSKGEYVSALAACPYYAHEDTCTIWCRGWTEDIGLQIRFQRAATAKRHKESCCRSPRGCSDCPIHQMVSFEIAGEEEKKERPS